MKRPFAAYQGAEPYVFVCYAHDDAEKVYPEIQRLHEGGVRIWYDEGISPGMRWSDELAGALSNASLVLFFCTAQSVKSKHCQDEVNFAHDKQRPLLVIQEGPVDLPLGMQLQIGAHQSILKHELSAEQFANKLTLAIGRHVTAAPHVAPVTKKVTRSLRRGAWRYVGGVGVAIALALLLWWLWPAITREPQGSAGHASNEFIERAISPSTSIEMEYAVAVLPFRSLTNEPATVAFAEGLADELVNELSGPMPAKVRRMFPPLLYALRVASATSTQRYRNSTEDLVAISRSLGAGYLVEGTVRSAGERVRVAVQLIHAATNKPVWSHSYDVSAADPLQAQTDVARHAARRIAWMVPDMYRVSRAFFARADAADYWDRGNREQMDSLTGGDVDFSAMLANLEKSLELDPAFVWTYENVVSAYLTLMDGSMEPVQTVAPIDELLTRVTGLVHDNLPQSLLDAHRAHYRLQRVDYAKASQYLREALRENPNDALALFLQSVLLLHQELPDGALASNRSAVDELPTSPLVQVGLARLLRARGQSSAAVKAIDSALELYPGDLGKAQMLIEQANAYIVLGKPDRAATLVDQAWDLCGANHPDLFPAALAGTGRADRARVILRDLEAAGHSRRFNPLDMIEGYVALGDLDSAFRWIDRAIDARFEPVVRWMHLVTVSVAGVWPITLTSDPRWRQAYAKLPAVGDIR